MILHLVVARFKPGTDPAVIRKFFEDLDALRSILPGIVSYTWGENDSPEGLSQGFTHALEMKLRDAAARDEYLNHPAHLALKQAIFPHLDNVIVVDYPL